MIPTPALRVRLPAGARPSACPSASILRRALTPLVLGLAAWLAAHGAKAAPGSGGLMLRAPDAAPVEAPQFATDIAVEVSGPTARAVVTQAFRNTTGEWVEGTYVYPLPEDAAVDSMKLVVGERVIVADIRERAAARRDYEAARRSGRAAALTEQERPNVFTNSVANIAPGETVLVQITYQQPVRLSGGTHALRVPLVVAPRYSPAPPLVAPAAEAPDSQAGSTDPVPDRARITPPVLDPAAHAPVNPVTLGVTLRAGFPLGPVRSGTHPVRIEETGPESRRITLDAGPVPADRDFELTWEAAPGRAPTVRIEETGPESRRITLDAGPVPADRDFELTWEAAPGRAPTVGLFRERVGADEYLLAVLAPPSGGPMPPQAAQRLPRDVVFVIDNSGSMAGASMRQAKASLLLALDRLDPSDRFSVIRFDDTMERLFPEPVPADAANLGLARRFVAGLEARGGTEMLAPLRAALADPHPDETGRVRQVIFLTDGAIGNEEQIFSAIVAGRGRSRLFMVGIGSAPNGHLLRHAAELGRGSDTVIGAIDQVAERTRALFAKLENPVVTDLSARFSEPGIEATPDPLPDLYRGEPVVIAAKLGRAAETLTLRGRVGGQAWEQVVDLAAAVPGAGIGKIWARARIGAAETARLTGRLPASDADAAILALALEHGLMTRHTSLVAVDATPRRPAGVALTAADLPLNLPAGWDFAAVFGERSAAPPPRERRAAVPVTTPAASPASRSIDLPQTASPAPLHLWLGLSLLALGLLALWRPAGRGRAR
ncbi:VIT domain-containing protein [Methylobacterium oryzisoli]|uniref:VIT domain-containing protein n=1 Tax=Methylobacterium oryzisoli TaxID=3385502 RepID=UPI00397DC9AC